MILDLVFVFALLHLLLQTGSLVGILFSVIQEIFEALNPVCIYILERGCFITVTLQVFQAAVPVAPVAPALRVAVSLLTELPVILQKWSVLLKLPCELILSVLKLDLSL